MGWTGYVIIFGAGLFCNGASGSGESETAGLVNNKMCGDDCLIKVRSSTSIILVVSSTKTSELNWREAE